MLEKLITDLKKSLPEPLRKKLGGEPVSEESEEGEEESESTEGTEEASEGETGASEEEKKKKQKSMIIRVIVVLALGYLAYDQFLAQPPEPTTEELLAKADKKPRKKRRPTDAKAAPTQGATADAAAKTPTPEPKPADSMNSGEPKNMNAPEQANVDMKPATNEPDPGQSIAPAKPEAQPPVEEIHIADKKADEPAVGEIAPRETESRGGEAQVDKSLDSIIDNLDKKEKKEVNLADKIVVDEVYTPPPAYDQLGRGLVYNCKEKYWSCVDKSSYVACNKNMKWNKAHGKPVECSIINVYSNDDDCNKVQKYNVSTSQATSFCQ